MEQGFANLWLFTSKNGQVVKKKEIVRDEVIDRFTRISFAANSNVSKRVAMLYYRNGTRRLVNMDEFSVQLKDFPKVDESMVAMQVFILFKVLVNVNVAMFDDETWSMHDLAKWV